MFKVAGSGARALTANISFLAASHGLAPSEISLVVAKYVSRPAAIAPTEMAAKTTGEIFFAVEPSEVPSSFVSFFLSFIPKNVQGAARSAHGLR